jgi:putative redox protein
MPEGVPANYGIEVVWEGGMRFRGGPAGGPTLLLDGDREAAPSPVDALLVSLAACSAIDVVEILEKRRTPAERVQVAVEFARAPTPPRRLTSARLRFDVTAGTDRSHVERAIELSFQKYCSVSASFAPDTELAWELELREPGGGVSG